MNPDLAEAVGRAFAVFCGRHGSSSAGTCDRRGSELLKAFAEGVVSAGVDVVDLGLTSTDELYFASGRMDAPGAVFTASHNPARYNGIKLCRAGCPAGRRRKRAA